MNPDCSTDTESVLENYLNTEKHFRVCIICSMPTCSMCGVANESEKLEIRSMKNYFCVHHYDIFERGYVAEKNEVLDQLKDAPKQRYLKIRKYNDAVWNYIQSIPIPRVRMHQRTLVQIHTPPKKPRKQSSGNFISQRYWGKEKVKHIEESRID
jgi:hypothetical protein